jgi:hypothetical protein
MVFIAAFSSQPVCLADRLGSLASAHRATGVKFYRKWPFASIIWPVPTPADRPVSLSQAQQEQQMSLAYQSFSDPRAALAFLAPVARSIGGPAVRAAATVGGNLFAPSPYGDFSVALLALGAIVSREG